MKKAVSIFFLTVLISSSSFAQIQDAEGCKDSPMFPKRMSNYVIGECKSNFGDAIFNTGADGSIEVPKEGTLTFVRYDFNFESGQQKPSALQILKNYENAAKAIGGQTLFQTSAGIGTYKIMKNGKEAAWVKIEGVGNDATDGYELTIIQLEEMKQEVTSDDILTALNNEGRIALYINFETGKSDIKAESQTIIDQIVQMLKSNPAIKISVEGHTDNTGNPASNMTLSDNRAKAVMSALVSKGIDKSRLSAKGWGQTKPLADNGSEDGKKKNRRVEIVKQ